MTDNNSINTLKSGINSTGLDVETQGDKKKTEEEELDFTQRAYLTVT